MMKYQNSKRLRALALLLSLLWLGGCSAPLSGGTQDSSGTDSAVPPSFGSGTAGSSSGNAGATIENTAAVSAGSFDLTVSQRDSDASWEKADAEIVFTETGVTVTGTGASASKTAVTVTAAGTYLLRGACTDGSILIDAPADEKVQLVLDGLTLQSRTGSPLVIAGADKVFLTLAQDSQNSLADAASYVQEAAGSSVDAAVFSKADLTINGSGSLTVTGNYKHGIVSKDDLVITGGAICVTAASTGLDGKDSVRITGGTLDITAQTNGIRSTNTEDASRGFVWISGGVIKIDAQTDGIQAETLLRLDGGTLDIRTGGGSANAPASSGKEDGRFGGFFGFFGGSTQTASDTPSSKGLKCTAALLITGGTCTLDCTDDAVHAGGDIRVSGGELSIATGDDGIHADSALLISGGTIRILKSYEGLEAADITISGGDIVLTSSDDGLNASGSGTARLTISGGRTVVNAEGDGIDSNGTLTITGGVTLVSGPTSSGNGALDYDSSASVTGGVLIACGSSDMAQNLNSGTQGVIMCTVTTQPANTTVALCGTDGRAIVSFSPEKQFSSVVISAPAITADGTYTLVTGKVSGADSFGYAENAEITVEQTLAEITMTSLIYGSGGGFGGGRGGTAPSRGGFDMNPPAGEAPDGNAPGGFGAAPPDGGHTKGKG